MPFNPYITEVAGGISDNINESLYVDTAPRHTAADFVQQGQQTLQASQDTRPAPTTIFHDTSVLMSDDDDAYYASLLKQDR